MCGKSTVPTSSYIGNKKQQHPWIMLNNGMFIPSKEQLTQTGYSRITAWIIWAACSTSSATTHMSDLLNFWSLVVLRCCSLASWYCYVPLLGGAFEIEAFHVNSANSPCWPKSAWQLLCSRSNIFRVFWWNHLHQLTRKKNGVFYRDLRHPKWRKQIWKRYVDSSIETTNPNNRWSYVKLTLTLHFLNYSWLFTIPTCFPVLKLCNFKYRNTYISYTYTYIYIHILLHMYQQNYIHMSFPNNVNQTLDFPSWKPPKNPIKSALAETTPHVTQHVLGAVR